MFGFGGVILLFRVLPKETYGVWVLFLSITSILEVGRIGLLQNAMIKYLATSSGDEETGKITTASLVLNGLMTLGIVAFLLLLCFPISQWLDAPELATLLKIYCLTTIALIPFFQGNYIQQANLDFRGIFWGNVVKGGILFFYILFLFVKKADVTLVQLAFCQIAAAMGASITAILFAKPFLRLSKEIDWEWLKKLFNFGKYVLGTNLSTQLYKNVDKLLLGGLPGGGQAAVALYDAAIKITNFTDVPTASMANMLYPQSAKRVLDGSDAVKNLYEKAVGAIMAFMLPCIIAVMIFADWIIFIVAGNEYSEAANILRVTILFGFFMPYAVQFGTVLDSIGKPRINFIYTIGSLILTALLNLFFINKYGAMGAAIGTLTAYAITFVFMQAFLRKHLKVNLLNPFVYMVHFYQKALKFGTKYAKDRANAEAI